MTRYQYVADQIGRQIRAGVLRPGERVPSMRQARRSYRVSPATVLQAYRQLESLGLIRARPRSGYFVCEHWEGLPAQPATSKPLRTPRNVDVSDLVFEILESTKQEEIIPLGSAFQDCERFPLQQLGRFLGAAARRISPARLADSLPPGYAELRRGIARRYLGSGFAVSPDDIVITTGGLEALHLAVQAVARPGDTVAIESPTFYSCLQTLELLGMKALELPTHPGEGIDLAALAGALRKGRLRACWLMTNFQNPLGSTMPEEKKRELVALLAKHDVPLIEDDVYEELYYGIAKPHPAKAFDTKGMVIHCSSFSKCLAPGYRVGWAAAGRFAGRMREVKLMTTLATNICAQAGISDYLRKGGYDYYLRGLRGKLSKNRDELLRAIKAHFPPGTTATNPDGGYFLWVELPNRVNALKLHGLAMDAGISIAPGPIFSANRRYGHCMRLNYGHPWSPRMEKAVVTLGRMVLSLI